MADREASFIMRLIDMVSGPLKGIASMAGDTTKKLNETTGAAAKLGKGWLPGGGAAGGGLGGLKSSVGGLAGSLRGAASEVPALNQAMGLLPVTPYAAAGAAVLGLGMALKQGVGNAMDFEKGMAQINTTARLSQPELTSLRKELLDMGADSTVNLAEIPGAFNQIISGVGNTKDALAIMGPALKASQAGFMDIRTAGDAAVNMLGALGADASRATEMYDVLTASVRLGKGEFKDYAAYLPKLLPLSQQMGLDYREIAASFALMTTQGQSAERTTTLLQNTLTALGKSDVIYGSKSKLGFKGLGIDVFDATGKMKSLGDIAGEVAKKTTGMTAKKRQNFYSQLGLDQEAASGLALLVQQADKLKEFTRGTKGSAGELAAAYQRSLSPADKLKMLQNQWQKVLTDIGYKILPYVNAALEGAMRGVEWIKKYSEPLGNFFGAVIAPLRLWWSLQKGIMNGLEWLYNQGSSVMERLFGGTGGIWQEIKGFLSNFYAGINLALEIIDDISEKNFSSARARYQKFIDLIHGQHQVGFKEFFGIQDAPDYFSDPGDDKKPPKTPPLTAALDKQNKGTDIEGDKSKARVVNVRIDKIEVINKIAGAVGQNLDDLGRGVASVIVSAVRDAEIVLSSGS